MLRFKPLTLADYDAVCKYLAYEKENICDTLPGTIFMWRHHFGTAFCIDEDMLFFRITYPDGPVAYSVPCGPGNLGIALQKLIRHTEGENLVFSPITSGQIELLKDHFTVAQCQNIRDWADYVYDVTAMQTFPGKKLHGQRNFLNRFNKLYPRARVEAISADNLELCRQFLDVYEAQVRSEGALAELGYVREVLDYYDLYGMLGTCVLVDGAVIAFAIGGKRGDMLYEHIEKASRDYPGAYQKIASEFAKMYGTSEIRFVNREDDMGNESLRTSKLAYHPVELLEKYVVYV
ncbi:MAG: DUF2156 domain-containing protein [Clostridia bacterium]|nr:DUF2156 domain-containing protein [Clostridia bacterium]